MNTKPSRYLRDVAETLLMTAVVFLLLVTFVIQGYKVSGSCMEPNLFSGERLLGNKFIYRFEKPIRGDVVVFKFPKDPNQMFIKRVVGLPGDVVEIRDGTLYVNERPLDEHHYRKKAAHGDFGPKKISDGRLFVLGDNRDESNDSRWWGELPAQNIQAKAWIRYWPMGRFAAIP